MTSRFDTSGFKELSMLGVKVRGWAPALLAVIIQSGSDTPYLRVTGGHVTVRVVCEGAVFRCVAGPDQGQVLGTLDEMPRIAHRIVTAAGVPVGPYIP